jgi:hypothetical protein
LFDEIQGKLGCLFLFFFCFIVFFFFSLHISLSLSLSLPSSLPFSFIVYWDLEAGRRIRVSRGERGISSIYGSGEEDEGGKRREKQSTAKGSLS